MNHEFLKFLAPTAMGATVLFGCFSMKSTDTLPALLAAISACLFVMTMIALYKPSK